MAIANPTAPVGAIPFRMTVRAPAGPMTFTAATIEALVGAFERWRDETGFGASEIGARFPVYRDGRKVGEVSYNGRWWPCAGATAPAAGPVSDGRLAVLIDRMAASGPPGDSLDIVRALQELQHRRREVAVQIDDAVPVMRLAAALAYAGLVIRHDRTPDRLVIREAGRLPAVAPELAALLNRIAASPRP
jgi:hypothetical protein